MTKEEALILLQEHFSEGMVRTIMDSLKQEQNEPVAYFNPQEGGFYWAKPTTVEAPITVNVEPLPLYTTPQLKQEQVEPVAIVDSTISGHIDWLCTVFPKQGTKLYTTPQTKEWVGLTNEQIVDLVIKNAGFPTKLAKAIEGLLKRKNT